MKEGVPKFADESETEKRFSDLERRLEAAESELQAWRNLTVDPASGGGAVTMGTGTVMLRINSLTNESAQMP